MHKPPRILVTGSSGRIGSQVAARFGDGATVMGVDIVAGEQTTHVASINDDKQLATLVEGSDIIIHCAAFHAPHVGAVDQSLFQKVNVEGTETLLNLALHHGVKRFVYTSSTSVYGCTTRPKTAAVWADESLPPYAEDIYDTTKLAAEQLCHSASESGLNTTILRMSRCFPEAENLMVFYRLYRGVGINDVVEAHRLAALSDIEGCSTFNISADSPFTSADLPQLLKNPWPLIEAYYPGTENFFAERGWEKPKAIDRVYAIDKAKRELNYSPVENFLEFLQKYR